MIKRLQFLCLFTIVLVPLAESSETQTAGNPLDSVCMRAMHRDWEGVLKMVQQSPEILADPVGRVVAAHASLAENQNNQSFALFTSLESVADLQRYVTWTKGLVARNAQATNGNAAAWFFRGDSSARQGDWPQAVIAFDQATRLDPDFSLAWNALGVTHAYLDHFKEAKDCFKRAAREDPSLADAYANLGTLLLIVEAAPGAVKNYRLAQEKSTDFALARNGEQCGMVAQGRDGKSLAAAVDAFSELAKRPIFAHLAIANLEAIGSRVEVTTMSNSEKIKGTTLSANQLRDLDSTTRQDIMRDMSRDQLQNIIRDSHDHYAHSYAARETLDYVNAIGGEWRVDSSQSERHASEHRQVFQDATGIMQERFGVSRFEYLRDGGGADTAPVSINNSAGDVGDWPAKATRFGLVPLAELPTVTVSRD